MRYILCINFPRSSNRVPLVYEVGTDMNWSPILGQLYQMTIDGVSKSFRVGQDPDKIITIELEGGKTYLPCISLGTLDSYTAKEEVRILANFGWREPEPHEKHIFG